MPARLDMPPFGTADLTNCERELIHLAGSVQPHGALLVLREPDLVVVQASANAAAMLGHPEGLLGLPLARLAADLARQLGRLGRDSLLAAPMPLPCEFAVDGATRAFDGLVHRSASGGLVLELEPAEEHAPGGASLLARVLTECIAGIRAASDFATLADLVTRELRELTGYDRVMLYRFDADGHGEVTAEARDPRFEPFLGLHYPASDIPQRARELYLRNRARLLVDVDYEPVPIEPRCTPGTGAELDLSLSHLRSISPLHLQYLRNMGVRGTLVVSLVREGRLWGLIACHHYSPKYLSYEWRAACELLAEVISTRIAALESYAQVQAVVRVRQLERHLADATAAAGDWRPALLDNASILLELVRATGLALLHEGKIFTAGVVPSTSELRTLAAWLARQPHDPLFHTAELSTLDPAFATFGSTAAGVLSAALSPGEGEAGEFLVWFRPEQLRTVSWAGDPNKPFVGNDPTQLSPRRSFAVWVEQVRGTAIDWSPVELAIAGAVRTSVADLALQVRSVRVLIAEQQANRARDRVAAAAEPTIIADGAGDILLANEAFQQLVGRLHLAPGRLHELASLFVDPVRARDVLRGLTIARESWRGELALAGRDGEPVPVAVRADVVPGFHGDALGYIVILTDLTRSRRLDAERRRLQDALHDTRQPRPLRGAAAAAAQDLDRLVGALLANTTAAVDEIGDGDDPTAVPLLREVENSLRRAADLGAQLLSHANAHATRPPAV